MKLLLDEHRTQMLANGERTARGEDIDPYPFVKLFAPDGAATWLLTELDPTEPDIAFGLCDLGMGCPELGSVSIAEISAVKGRMGLAVERDLHFKADKPLSAYTAEAARAGCIVT